MKSPVLRFPDHEARRLLDVVPVLEADDGVLGQRRVVDFEGRQRLPERLQRHVLLPGLRVVIDGVPVAEGAALDILSRQADGRAVGENRRQRQLFAEGPVDRPLVRRVERAGALLARALQLSMKREAVRRGQQARIDLAQPLDRDRGPRGRGGAGRRFRRFGLDEITLRLERLHRGLERREPPRVHVAGHLARDRAALDERTRPDLAHGRMRSDLPVHQRLGERRLVSLVVAVAAVADEIDEEIELEGPAIGNRQPRRLDARLGIVRVHVHDRNLEAARQAARVRGAVGVFGTGRESELVVDDDVDRAAGRIARQAAQVQRFGHDALAGKRRVAMDEDRQARVGVEHGCARLVHRGSGRARHADDDRIDRLEMARVGRHRDRHVHPAAALDRAMRAGVVLHVAGPRHVFAEGARRDRILELGEHLRVRLVEHVRHDVQAAAVGHADEDVARAGFGRVANHLVEDRHEHVEPLDREPRLAGERPLEEALERFDFREPIEQRHRIDRIGRRAEAAALDRLAQPLALVGNEHVRQVVPGRGAVDAAERLDDLGHVRGAGAQGRRHQVGRKVVKLGLRHAVRFGQQRRVAGWTAAERIQLGRQMTVSPDRLRQIDGADDLPDGQTLGNRRRRVLRRRPPALEKRPGFRVHGRGVLPVPVVQLEDVAAVEPGELLPPCHISTILPQGSRDDGELPGGAGHQCRIAAPRDPQAGADQQQAI